MESPKLLPAIERKELPGDEQVLTSPDGSTAIIINTTGAVVADLCDGTRTIDDIASFIAENVAGTDPSSVRRDVERLVGDLRAAGLLEVG